jgi:hypothetical protein
MILEVILDYLTYIAFGFLIGIFISWAFSKQQNKTKHIARVIDAAFIEKNVSELVELTVYLDQVISLIKVSSDELNERVKITRDIEIGLTSLRDKKLNIEELDLKNDIDILEKNL